MNSTTKAVQAAHHFQGWFRYTLVMSANFTLTAYFDEQRFEETLVFGNSVKNANNATMSLGKLGGRTVSGNFTIDDLMIFDTALTQDQFESLPRASNTL